MKYAILLLCAFLICSCNSTQKMLCKTWKVDDLSFGGGATSNSPIQQMIRQQLSAIKITFKKDGSYIVNRKDTTTVGTWTLSADKTIVHTKTGPGTYDSKLLSLTKSKMVFENVDSSTRKMVFTCSPAPAPAAGSK